MIPILFRPDADPEALIDANSIPLEDVDSEQLLASGDYTAQRNFTTLGLGKLTDCISCEVKEERNGEYELMMEYPMDGVHFSEIENRSIIWAKPNYTDNPQAFRVYQITSPIDGVIEVNAAHISYDLSGVPVAPFTATSCSAACAGLMSHAMIDTPFSIGTTVPTIADFKTEYPTSARSLFGGMEGSLLDIYGGEWKYDNYTCTLMSARGQNRGVVIRYGKNLLDLRQESNIENVYTGVLAYWKNEILGQSVQTNIINVAGTFNYRKILVLDLSLEFTDKPTVAQLTAKAQSYITQNNIGRPNVNITLDWVQVGELTDRVDLCDTVTVIFEKLGIQTTAKCISTTWDVLADRYKELEIGDAKANMPSTIAGLQETEKVLTTSVTPSMQRAINNATALITGNSGGYVVMHDGDGDGYPDELLVMDTPDISTATKVWRWNQNGLGYSASGYSGTFGLAMTANGEIVADYITTGTLSADRILGGTLKLGGTNNQNGTLALYDSSDTQVGTMGNTGLDFSIAPGENYSAFRIIENVNSNFLAQIVAVRYLESGVYNTRGACSLAEVNPSGAKINTQLSLDSRSITLFTVSNNAAVFRVSQTGMITSTGTYSSTGSNAANMWIGSDGQMHRSTSSSKRYKHDITSKLTEDPEKLYDVEVRQYKYNDDYLSKDDQRYGKDIIGFIAEEVAEAMPGAVDYDDEGRPEMWNVHVIVPAMMKLIQNQKKEIDELKARLDRLEARFSDDGR